MISNLYGGQGEPSQAADSDNSNNYLLGKARRIWHRLNLLLGTRPTPAADISLTGASSPTAVSEKTKQYVKFP